MIFDRGRCRMTYLLITAVLLTQILVKGLEADLDSHGTSPSLSYLDGSTIEPSLSFNASDTDEACPCNVDCNKLSGDCIDCDYDVQTNCTNGLNVSVTCHAKPGVPCLGAQNFSRWMTCRYCYQTPHWQHQCTPSTACRVVSSPRQWYQANCSVNEDILCLGNRRFYKGQRCNWTSGKRWSTALILSITLGGFGADRFYLGLWKEGLGKLFSLGGLGVWTLVDVILIGTGYVGPADGSLYIM